MNQKVLLVTPPFTQLNTPYPATAYIKGFLNTIEVPSFQIDLGIEVINQLFSVQGLSQLFSEIEQLNLSLSTNSTHILQLKEVYIQTIEPVVRFLQYNDESVMHRICSRNFLPEGSRFQHCDELEWAFGTNGIRDKARHLATLYLEDISDLIIESIDPRFGFSRYAEKLARTASSFDSLYEAIVGEKSLIDRWSLALLENYIQQENPTIIALTAPFPGNVYSAFICAKWVKSNHPDCTLIFGGGYANTELRSLKDKRVFEFFDFITLDDGEAPIHCLLEYLDGKRPIKALKRTYTLHNDQVTYIDDSKFPDYKQSACGTPDYSNLKLDTYLSVIEIANAMHRLWSDGRWNKLTLAHGCYWSKCTFCDVTLDYIRIYEATTAKQLVDRIEAIIIQTGTTGFHFVDEAAPPALLRELSLELLRRKISITWWTNIRFEKSFTADLCRLLAKAGCIAVSGGLEVASDRLLELIDKGVTVPQVAQVTNHFTQVGINVHAYLMYGYPTQTIQETIDSLEMVRQLFNEKCIQSGFWHQFALTAHSPIGKNPEKFGIQITSLKEGDFANNDLFYEDETGIDHSDFSEGLRVSLYNYMHGLGLEDSLQNWFDFQIPKTTIEPNFIQKQLHFTFEHLEKPSSKIVWIGPTPIFPIDETITSSKKQKNTVVQFFTNKYKHEIKFEKAVKTWIIEFLRKTDVKHSKSITLQEIKTSFEIETKQDFDSFWSSYPIMELKALGLLVI